MAANDDKDGQSTLTPDDRGRLADNFKGYDISPDMVRLSLVNMYLHEFREPHIYEYDTLTSDERWNEYADVILANPPFMSPRGGIRPHNRFSVQSKRSEVLFVDYMAEHLTPTGRAGFIVPEGIIFQSQNAYKQLRKMLVEDYLVAVISLPSGVFNPYSGVKTSILILDKTLARKADGIAFFKVENDGYGLGAQRRPIAENDLPDIARAAREYLDGVSYTNGAKVHESAARYDAGSDQDGSEASWETTLIVSKDKIAESGDYNLSGERYQEDEYVSEWPMVALSNAEVFQIESGGTPKSNVKKYWNGGIPWITLVDLPPEDFISEIVNTQRTISEDGLRNSSAKLLPENSVVVSSRATIGRIGINRIPLATNQGFKNVVIKDANRAIPEYVALSLIKLVPEMQARASGSTYKEITKTVFSDLKIPLPPLEVQREIVAEIEGYQKVIDGARAVLDNYRPHIAVDPDWPLVEIRNLAKPQYGFTASAQDQGDTRFIRITDISQEGFLSPKEQKFITLTGKSKDLLLARGDILVARTGATFGKTMLFNEDCPAVFASYLIRLRFPPDIVDSYFYWAFAQSDDYWNQAKLLVSGGGQPQFNGNAIKQIRLPLPPLSTQRAIVAEIEAEQTLVAANRELVQRMEKKIEAAIARVWQSSQ